MQSLLDERKYHDAKIKDIDAALYVIHMSTCVDKAHNYIQEKYETFGDTYYLVAADIANRLLSGYSKFYKYQCAIESSPLLNLEIVADMDQVDLSLRIKYYVENRSGNCIDSDMAEKSEIPEIIEAMKSNKLHAFNIPALMQLDDEDIHRTSVANLTENFCDDVIAEINDDYIEHLCINNEALTYQCYVERLDARPLRYEGIRFGLRIPIMLIKCNDSIAEHGLQTKIAAEF